jgi:phytase-like protein
MMGRRGAVMFLASFLAALHGGCKGSSRAIVYPDAALIESRRLLQLPNGVTVHEGGYGSAIALHPTRPGWFYLLADRGPNVDTDRSREKRFLIPGYAPRIGLFELRGSVLRRRAVIELQDASGRGLSGLPNPRDDGPNETAVDLTGTRLDLDPGGLDPEGLVALADGTFWICDEYGPHLLHVDRAGRTLERISPMARDRQGRALPRVLAKRRPNRGMEGLTITPDGRALVGLMQSALDNPSPSVRPTAAVSRLLVLDLATGGTRQLVYLQERPALVSSEITALSGTAFLVLERDERFAGDPAAPACKRIYRIDIRGATDVSDPSDGPNGKLVAGRTLEELSPDQLRAAGIVPVTKTLVIDLLALPAGYPHDKPEGLAVIDGRILAVSNDDDFGVTDGPGAAVAQKTLPGAGQRVDRNEVRFVDLATARGGGSASR